MPTLQTLHKASVSFQLFHDKKYNSSLSRCLDTFCFHIGGSQWLERHFHWAPVISCRLAKPSRRPQQSWRCRKSTLVSSKRINAVNQFEKHSWRVSCVEPATQQDEDEANGRTDFLRVTAGSLMPSPSLDTRERCASRNSPSLLSPRIYFRKKYMYLCSAWNITSSLAWGAQENTWRLHPPAYLATQQQQVGISARCVCVSWDVWNPRISTFIGVFALTMSELRGFRMGAHLASRAGNQPPHPPTPSSPSPPTHTHTHTSHILTHTPHFNAA